VAKTKQEMRDEYEKEYLKRIEGKEEKVEVNEESKESPGLQDIIFQMTQKIKEHETKDYIGLCAHCKKPITREELAYQKGKSFHTKCYDENKNEIVAPTPEIANKSANMKAELALLKNLQIIQSANEPVKKHTTKSKRKKTVKRKKKSKTRKQAVNKKKKQGLKKKKGKKPRRILKRKKPIIRRKKPAVRKIKKIKKKAKRKAPRTAKIKRRKLNKKTKRRRVPKKSTKRRR